MKSTTTTQHGNFDATTVPGMTLLTPGDVIAHQGGVQFICLRCSPSGATMQALAGVSRTVTKKVTGETKTFTARSQQRMQISANCPPEMIIERRGEKGLQDFLNAKTSPRTQGEINGDKNNNEESNNMKNATSKPRGGLAAVALANKKNGSKIGKPAKEGASSKGALGELFGHSVTGVIRTLAVKTDMVKSQIIIALKEKGFNPAEATVQIQMSRGRNKVLPTVDLTGVQIAEMKKLGGPAPKDEPKAEKKAKKDAKPAAKKATKKPAKAKTEPEAVATVSAPENPESPAAESPAAAA